MAEKFLLKKELTAADGIEITSTRMSKKCKVVNETELEQSGVENLSMLEKIVLIKERNKTSNNEQIKENTITKEENKEEKEVNVLDLNKDKIIDTKNTQDDFLLVKKIRDKIKKKKNKKERSYKEINERDREIN